MRLAHCQIQLLLILHCRWLTPCYALLLHFRLYVSQTSQLVFLLLMHCVGLVPCRIFSTILRCMWMVLWVVTLCSLSIAFSLHHEDTSLISVLDMAHTFQKHAFSNFILHSAYSLKSVFKLYVAHALLNSTSIFYTAFGSHIVKSRSYTV